MTFKKLLLLFSVFFAISQLLFAAQKQIVQGSVNAGNGPLVIITHPSLTWDETATTRLNINQHSGNIKRIFDEFNRDLSASTFEVAPPYVVLLTQGSYFVALKNIDTLLYSSGGEHSITTQSENAILMGGRFTECASKTIRDLILNNRSIKNIYLLTDAMYHYNYRSDGDLVADKLSFFVAKHSYNADDFLEWVKKQIFWQQSPAGRIFLGSATNQARHLYLDQYCFNLYYKDRWMGALAVQSCQNKRAINLYFSPNGLKFELTTGR